MVEETFTSLVRAEDLAALNQKVKNRGHVDREHLMAFLELVPSSDGKHIILEVKKWLYDLHNDPLYDKVVFPAGNIEAVISDLDSYGRVQPETILKYKTENARTVATS